MARKPYPRSQSFFLACLRTASLRSASLKLKQDRPSSYFLVSGSTGGTKVTVWASAVAQTAQTMNARMRAESFMAVLPTLNTCARKSQFPTKNPPARFFLCGRNRLNPTLIALVHRIAVGVDLPDLTQFQRTDSGFNSAHVADHNPDEMVGLDEPFGDGIGLIRGQG